MRFKINEIGPEGLPVKVAVTAEWLAAACPDLEGRPAKDGLNLIGRISQVGDDYLFRADLTGALETACARCLEPARVPLQIPFTLTYVSSDELDTDEDEDTDIIPFTGGDIDVSDEVRDEIALALPMNPLCTETCRGLCPVCGGNRNLVACACEVDRAPPSLRLAELGKIKL